MALLTGKQVLITGASQGIGAATAHLFAEHGASLFLNGRQQGSLVELCQTLTERYGTCCTPLCFDVGDAQAVKSGFQTLFHHTKRLDVLVNNAGILSDGLVSMMAPEQIQQTFATNSFGVLYCSQYASRLMQRNGAGSIINMTSIMGVSGAAGQSVYGGSKAAVIGITRSLAKELAPQKIRVNAIAPGFIDTEMTGQLSAEKYQQRLDSIAMGYVGQPEDVAKTALYLASELSAYVTGQVIGVDGGMLI